MTGYTDSEGIPTGRFGTADHLTRTQAAVMLRRMARETPTTATSVFPDVSVDT